MSKVEKIKAEIKKLPPKQFRRIRKWVEEYDADVWDKEIEEDAKAGRLDWLIEEALEEHRKGKTRPWP